jgi:anti-sigma factor RsiW
MIKVNIKNKCSQTRNALAKAVAKHLSFNSGWLQEHIANCPRCQQRLSRVGRVSVALSLLKSQPHALDLLKRANAQAINVLKHGLREAPKAEKLREIRPEPKWFVRYSRVVQPVANAAACILILVLLKLGVFSSMDNIQRHGNSAVKHYYSRHLDQGTVNDIFNI